MPEANNKKNHPPLWLLLIPGTLLADLGVLLLGTTLDDRIFSDAEAAGHGFPLFTLITLLAAGILSIVMLIITIVLIVNGFRKRKKPANLNTGEKASL